MFPGRICKIYIIHVHSTHVRNCPFLIPQHSSLCPISGKHTVQANYYFGLYHHSLTLPGFWNLCRNKLLSFSIMFLGFIHVEY